MKKFAFAAVLAVAGLAGFSQRADAQYLYSYGSYFPGGGRAWFGSTQPWGYYPGFAYPYDVEPWGGWGFRFGKVYTPAVPTPARVYSPQAGMDPAWRRGSAARYWRKD